MRRGPKPAWSEAFRLDVSPDRHALEVSVWDKVKWLADNELGRLFIRLDDVRKLKNGRLEAWFAVVGTGKDPRLSVGSLRSGELLVSLQFGFTEKEQASYIRCVCAVKAVCAPACACPHSPQTHTHTYTHHHTPSHTITHHHTHIHS